MEGELSLSARTTSNGLKQFNQMAVFLVLIGTVFVITEAAIAGVPVDNLEDHYIEPQAPSDLGYSHLPRGWYDATSIGSKLDYGRWVGGLNSTIDSTVYWSVAIAGSDSQYTEPGKYNQPTDISVLADFPDMPAKDIRLQAPSDLGYSHLPRGWYDAKGNGGKFDYGRWVGGRISKNGGKIWWSVALAGSDSQYTEPGAYKQPKDTSVLADVPDLPEHDIEPQSPSDLGYSHLPRGWYDATGVGSKEDYGRWVGGGIHKNGGKIWWSVAIAGSDSQYTEPGMYTQPDPKVLAAEPEVH